MADKLAGLLSRLGGEGATLVRGRISAVSTGALTVLINGDEVSKIGYLKGSWIPKVGEEVFLLNQANFGMIALGAPVMPDAPGTLPAQQTLNVTPSALANWSGSAWVVSGTGVLTQAKDFQSSGAWFYNAADFVPWATTALSRVEIQLTPLSGIPELTLHRNASVGAPLDAYEGPLTLNLTPAVAQWVPLPLSWGRDLLSGAAKGVALRSQQFDAVMDLSGSLRFTSL